MKKYYFYKTKVDFFSFIIDKNSLHMDPSRVKAISEWHNYLPKIYYNIQVFLRFYNFYRQFIYNFTGIAQPLH
jgi:hypothetical protein